MARYGTAILVSRWTSSPIPWGTWTANVLGCFVMGLLASVAVGRSENPFARAFVLTGFLGGYTTFSSFANESLLLARYQDIPMAAAYVLGTFGATLAAVWLGHRLGTS